MFRVRRLSHERELDSRNVGEMKCRGWREDVVVVLGVWLLEPVQRGVGVIFGESGVLNWKQNTI